MAHALLLRRQFRQQQLLLLPLPQRTILSHVAYDLLLGEFMVATHSLNNVLKERIADIDTGSASTSLDKSLF